MDAEVNERSEGIETGNLFGVGLYTVPEASHITRISTQHIRRWLWGYRYTVAGQKHRQEALWTPQLPIVDHVKALSFRDLIEVQFVQRFREEGLSLQFIRKTIDLATALLDKTYPLSSVKFKTDGRRIMAEVVKDFDDERHYVFDLENGQYYLQFVLDYLYDALEYSNFDQLVRWWPLGRDHRVVIDPKKSFGRPIVVEGVPTAALSGSYKAEGSIAAVAAWYEVSEESVTDALAFERSRKAA